MYWGIGILLILSLFLGGWCVFLRRRAAKKVCCIDACERLCRVNEILEPFGFVCDRCGCMVKTTWDAWQRQFGYCTAYDKSAVYFQMVFDCEPVYFYYDGRTWLIEFWKGQYGINTGGEIGIYHTGGVIPEKDLSRVVFESASDEEMLPVSMTLRYAGRPVLCAGEPHWWLACFLVGVYCEPEDLVMEASVTFPNQEMREAFVTGMRRRGYGKCALTVCHNTVSFEFAAPKSRQFRGFLCLRRMLAQWKNRQFCRLFTIVTRPFTGTVEQILFLYYFLPPVFRRMMRFRKNRRQKL